VLVHDFWCRRQYRRLLRHSDVVGGVDTLVVLKKKKSFDNVAALRDLKTYMFLPSDETPLQERINGYISEINQARQRWRRNTAGHAITTDSR
jgi:hypothetical protein